MVDDYDIAMSDGDESMDCEEELRLLQYENDLPIEELMVKYIPALERYEEAEQSRKRSFGYVNTDSDAHEDGYHSDESYLFLKKKVCIGINYQASVPVRPMSSAPPEGLEISSGTLMWDPRLVVEKTVDSYIKRLMAYEEYRHHPLEDIALQHLLRHDCDVKAALDDLDSLFDSINAEFLHWSIHDCAVFECGIEKYGKKFFLIHENMMQDKSYLEVIHFYYLWKKSSRVIPFLCKIKRDYVVQPDSQMGYINEILLEKDLPYKADGENSYSLDEGL